MEKGDTTLIHFLTKEGLQIQEAYGNHASFVMMAIGNELSGDQDAMVDMIARFRSEDGRHLYASGSNDYLGFNGPAAGDDYFTTCRVPGANVFSNHTRGSFSFADAEDGGYINHTYPNSVMNFESAIEQCSLPIIGHETGQFQCYPNYEEIKKYTGALKPWNPVWPDKRMISSRLPVNGWRNFTGPRWKWRSVLREWPASNYWIYRIIRDRARR